jgi:L-fuconolactonase
LVAGIVGFADLRLGRRAGETLDLHIEVSDGRFRGVRQGASWDEDPQIVGMAPPVGPGLYARADFRDGVRELTKRGLTFDAWLYQTQQDDLIALASAMPDQQIVVNHCGGILGINRYSGRGPEMFEAWKGKMRSLAQLPNVSVKLGGLGMHRSGLDFGSPHMPTSSLAVAKVIRPWIEFCIGLFGPERCMFEGNFPVDRAAYSYRVMWNAFKHIALDVSEDERGKLFSGTAKRLYRLC